MSAALGSQPEVSSRMHISVDELGAAFALPISLVFAGPQTQRPENYGIFNGWQWETLRGKLLRAGIDPTTCQIITLADVTTLNLNAVIVGFGEEVLRFFTDKRGIDKWNLSPLTSRGGQKFIPTFDISRVNKQFELNLYQELALMRAQKERLSKDYYREEERFRLNPGIGETLSILNEIKDKPELSVDVETGYGQINTVGFAWSVSDAIAINVLPDNYGDHDYYELWKGIAAVLGGQSKKIFQNFIYDVSYFSAYGIRTENIHHDTMHAMKFLWPEFKSNLGNVGRFYTNRVYWKDDGKVTDEEGVKKNWGDIRDWHRHYLYNCRDTTGTFAAYKNQQLDIEARGMVDTYRSIAQSLIPPVLEMCSNGMPVNNETRVRIKGETEEEIRTLTEKLHAEVGADFNPRSPKQVLKYLVDNNIKVPKRFIKEAGVYRQSTDASSLKKIRLRYPELKFLSYLQRIKILDKALSSYLDATLRGDGKISYSLNACGTETLRMSGGKDGWNRGFNIHTVPREGGEVSIKSMFAAPEGQSFVEVDLRQAESRFVAYDAADKTLIDMLESGADVHSHVGNEILRQMGRNPADIPPSEFKQTWRQLGKKAGHGLNYFMKETQFVETVFNELDIVIAKKDATVITKAYYGLFPGIPRWHARIRNEIYNKKKLTAPSGWERYFYGRPGNDMYKEAYAWRPQHTIPWITNNLMFHLMDLRNEGKLIFDLIYQGHDSLVMLAPDNSVGDIARVCLDTKAGHPVINLAGGQLYIPREIKFGKCMANMEEYK